MHATLAYLNAAGARRAGSGSGSAFMQVMDSLLANTQGVSRGQHGHDSAEPGRHAKQRRQAPATSWKP